MNARPLLLLAAIAAATSPDIGKGTLDRFKGGVRDGFARDPMGSVLAAVLGGAWLFYKAERGHNPKVKSYYDALVYVSTNLSVGYSDIFAKTPRGKAIGTALMTYGPAMAAKIFDTPTAPTAPVVAAASAPTPAAAPVISVTGPAPIPSPAASAPSAPSALIGSQEVLDRLDRILAVLEANRDATRAAQPPTA
jgi:voltage-gated potassium channel